MDREMEPLCERQPGPMDHVKIERKSTVMYSNTGVKVNTQYNDFISKVDLRRYTNFSLFASICHK